MTISIDIGAKSSGARAVFDLEELLATRLLVQGNSGSGKSHLLRRLLEQSAPWVQQCVIDPEGDFVTLADAFGHVVIDAAACERDLVSIADRVRRHRVSVIVNLEGLEVDKQMRAAALFLNGLFEVDRDLWYPMLVVVDEAQLFAPAAATDADEEARRQSLAAMTNLMCRGRKRGLAGVIATQRLAKLAKNVAAEASNFLMGRTFLDIDMARAADLLGMERRQAETFRNLDRGAFVALGPAIGRKPESVKIGTVQTVARGGGPKLTPLPESPAEDAAGLIFRAGPDEARPRPLQPRPSTEELMAKLAEARDRDEQPAPTDLFARSDRDQAIGTVISDMMAEPDAGFRAVSLLYQDFLVRCRIARIPGEPLDLPRFRKELALAKAGVGGTEDAAAHQGDWAQATLVAAALPEDVRGVFLLVARAALTGAPCPTDAEIARAYGTRSNGRARRLLAYMEERGFIHAATDLKGARVVSLPDLGWRTAPGQTELAAAG